MITIRIDDIDYNETKLTDEFFLKHSNATFISISDHLIKEVPESIAGLKHLEHLYLSGCKSLEKLPDLSNLKELTNLDLSGTNLKTPPEFPNTLRRLDLIECVNLKTLPASIVNLKELKLLYLSGCENLETLSDSISSLKKLTSISLKNCKSLKTFPALDPNDFKSLTSIDLRGCDNLMVTTELIKNLNTSEEDMVHVLYPTHFNPKIFTQIAEDRLLKVIERYNGQENIEPSEIIPAQDESQGIKKLFNRFLTEEVDERSNKISSMAKALEITELAEPFLNFIEKEENLKNLSWINKLADNYLVACINQPVLGFFVINSFIDIAEKEKFSDKIMSAKPLFALAGINEIIAGNRLGEEVQAEAGNVLLIELHKQLLNEKIIQEPWLGVTTKIAYAETVKSFVEKEEVKSALTELKTKITNLTTEQCADLLCSPSGIDNQHQNAWAETAFPKNEGIKEIKDTFKRKYDEAINSNQPSNSNEDAEIRAAEMEKYKVLQDLTASKDADITNKIVELTKIELEKEGKALKVKPTPSSENISRVTAEEAQGNTKGETRCIIS